MNRRAGLALLIWLLAVLLSSAHAADAKIRVLIVDGFSNHDWRQTTSLLRGLL